MTAIAERRTGIITPEAVLLEFETASVASRVLARLLDGAVLWIGLLTVATTLGAGVAVVDSTALAIILLVFVIFFVLFGYWVVFETMLRGRTIGKMALGIRVVTIEGAPVRFRHSAIRAIVGLIDFIPVGPAVAIVSVLVNSKDQRLGDMAAGTIVLRERSATGEARSLLLTEPPNCAELMATLQLSRLTDAQYNAIRRFLLRTETLTPAARAQLATQLATSVATATGVPKPAELHPEWFLHAAGLAHQRRTETRSGSSPGHLAPPPPPPPTGLPVASAAPPSLG